MRTATAARAQRDADVLADADRVEQDVIDALADWEPETVWPVTYRVETEDGAVWLQLTERSPDERVSRWVQCTGERISPDVVPDLVFRFVFDMDGEDVG